LPGIVCDGAAAPSTLACMTLLSLSLKTRIALSTVAIATVFGAAIALASVYFAQRDVRHALQEQQDSIVELTVKQLDTAMNDRITLLEHVAAQLAGHLDEGPMRLRERAQRNVPVPESFDGVVVADAQGKILTRSGDVVDVADRDYFLEVARTLQPVISAPLRARVTGTDGVMVSVPILSPRGEFRGLVGGWLDLSRSNFLVELSHSRLGTTGFYCLVSGGGKPVYVQHPDTAQALRPASALGDTCGTSGRSGFFEFLRPQRPVIARYLMESTGWELVAVLPAREAFAPLRAMELRVLYLLLAAVATGALLIWLAVRRMLAPLTRLHQVVRDSEHDPAAYARLPHHGGDEISDLGRAFAQLMRELERRRELLDANERRLRAVTDTLPSLLAFVGTDERYLFNNIAYEHAYGIPLARLRGMTMREVIGERRYGALQPHLRQALGGTPTTFEFEENEPAYRCLEVNLRPEWDPDGARVVGVHVHVLDVTQRKLETLRLSRISRLDHLTQLLNRSGFEKRLGEAMARSREKERLMALFYLDMDRFKAVNDFHGHGTGDLLLQAFARRVQRCVRETDAVARLGGDEFAVILEGLGDAGAARRVAQSILDSVGRQFHINGIVADVDVSIGVALYRGAPMADHELVREADVLLYRAKAAGRGRYEIGPEGLSDL